MLKFLKLFDFFGSLFFSAGGSAKIENSFLVKKLGQVVLDPVMRVPVLPLIFGSGSLKLSLLKIFEFLLKPLEFSAF